MIWDVYQSLWETAYQQAEAYVQRHGHLRVSKDSGPDQFLGRWISTQRKNYKKGVLNEERTRKLETLGMVWDAGVDSEELWEQWFRKASAYYAAHGHLNPMEGELRTWVLAQRAAKKGKPTAGRDWYGLGAAHRPVAGDVSACQGVLSGPSDAQCSLQL